MQVVNQTIPSQEQMNEFFGSGEDGPFVMVNLLKFKTKAEYADNRETDLSGAEAYAIYGAAVGKCIADVGGTPGFAGQVTGLLLGEVEENWDMVALVEYPSLEAFRTMMTSPEYQKIAVHRSAGLAGQLNIKTKARALG
ncbi:MAG: DUF1330 domain-containing protein [Erythrobacter sp.]|uniref:DUF1330 domain-containing protein n=1 Tax=Erythrobacter sp. TaxID=1042 RepID=UPI0032654D0C